MLIFLATYIVQRCSKYGATTDTYIYPARASGYYRVDYVRRAITSSCTGNVADVEAVRFFPAGLWAVGCTL